jgi:hypothetical protein
MRMCLAFFMFGFGLCGLYFKHNFYFYASYVLLVVAGVSLGRLAYTQNMNRNQRLANHGINWKHRTCALVGAVSSFWVTPWIISLFK